MYVERIHENCNNIKQKAFLLWIASAEETLFTLSRLKS